MNPRDARQGISGLNAGEDGNPDSGDEQLTAAWREMRRHRSDRACDDGCDSELDCAAAVIAAVRQLIEAETAATYVTLAREEMLALTADLTAKFGTVVEETALQVAEAVRVECNARLAAAVAEVRADERNRIAHAIDKAANEYGTAIRAGFGLGAATLLPPGPTAHFDGLIAAADIAREETTVTVRPPRAGDRTALAGQASYMFVRPHDAAVARTHELCPTLLVDTDADGRVLGIESLNGEVDVADLLRVITAARLRDPGEA